MVVSEEEADIKLKTRFQGQVVVLYCKSPLKLNTFFSCLREACKQPTNQPITVKWIDDEGDPCTISSQRELDEAVRLTSDDAEINLHVFMGKPTLPGLPCQGEDKNVYRRGARRWNKKKFYHVNGHRFQAKRLNKRTECFFCHDSIWGIGRQGYRCVDCQLCSSVVPPSISQNRPLLSGASLNGSSSLRGFDGAEHIRPAGAQDNIAYQESEIEASEAAEIIPQSHNQWSVSLDDFQLLTVIGRGSYAKVVQAEHKRTGSIYAIKIIKKEMFNEDEDIEWVQTEKSVFETASNHPFLVGLHSCFQTDSRLFFVIEFVPGGDLMFHMQNKKKLPEEHARFYSAEIIIALHFLHSRGIVYRDLKLDNVLIDSIGHIKLTDYGMCKENMGPNETTSTFCGTPNYIAPEILRGEEYGFSVDWWALGVLMYEMMAGRSPFDVEGMTGDTDQHTEDYLFQSILEKQIRIPRSLSVKAAGVLKGFLNKLEAREVTPPYNPSVEGDRDLQHFDKLFTDEPPTLTFDDPNIVAQIDQSEFEGFEYVNPLLMSKEDSV
ncbi:hypothetical protein QR680_000121 [Steinernema hermaphroditum]|uniref:Protein kinase C-like 3 n=1 Tax=Steinernema hermaphroditum TaxID=289476 RepID=A0AA39LDJ1_9BILA|nr:hypothetical protein QR680_000121 [Steinernema hermaphroditum]